MKYRLNLQRALVLAFCIATVPMGTKQGFAQADAAPNPGMTKKRSTGQPQSSIEAQLQEMRGQLRRQQEEIDQLKRQLQGRDRQLRQAQGTAQAQQATGHTLIQTRTLQQSPGQGTLDKTESRPAARNTEAALAQPLQAEPMVEENHKRLEQAVEHPDAIYYKGIAFSPFGSFIEAATVYRSAATGGGITTPFAGIPLQHADAAQMSEFYGSARQSRIALKASGELPGMTLTGYYEMDWLGTGITSNNNQSNSYVVRQRQLWVRTAFRNGWSLTGGQMWSLATETSQGETAGTEALPSTIDPQYTAGFVWARQYAFRVDKNFDNKFWLGASVENPETLNPEGSNLPTNLLIGSAGAGAGFHNSLANYSFNLAPDMIAKAVFEPGFGHYEIFGIARFFRDRIYPVGGAPYNDSTNGGGIGGSVRTTAAQKKWSAGLKGLYGRGVGRYGDSQIADVTLHPDGRIAPLRGFSALATLEFHPIDRLNLWVNYGGDYVYRNYIGKVGYGSPLADMSGCNIEPQPSGPDTTPGFDPATPSNCEGNNKSIQELSLGYWFNFYAGSKGRLRQGMQYSHFERDLWSGAGGVTNPGGAAKGTDNMYWTSFRYYLP